MNELRAVLEMDSGDGQLDQKNSQNYHVFRQLHSIWLTLTKGCLSLVQCAL